MAIDPAPVRVGRGSLVQGRVEQNLEVRRMLDTSQSSGVAFGLYLVFVVLTLLSFPSRIPVIGVVRPTVVMIALISALLFMSSGVKKDRDDSSTTRYLLIFVAYVAFSIPFVQWPGSVLRFGLEGFVKVAVFFFFTVRLIDTFRRFRQLVVVVVSCQIFRVLEPLYLHITTGYWGSRAHMGGGEFMARLSGGPHDIINPNGLAFVILTALPFLHYLLGGSEKKALQVIYLTLLPFLLYAFMLTGSRSGLVGLLVLFAVIVFKSRHRAILTAAAVVGAMLLVGIMSEDMRDRYISLVDVETRHGETRQGRLEGVRREFSVAMRRPVFGHGLGTSSEAMANFAGSAQIAHNLYTEVAIETGFVGLALYLAILRSIVGNVRRVRPSLRMMTDLDEVHRDAGYLTRHHFYDRCANAILAWVAMCLVFSLASYGLSEFYWYLTAGLSVSLLGITTRERLVLQRASAGGARSGVEDFDS